MASISGSGTGCAAPTWGWPSGGWRVALTGLSAPMLLANSAQITGPSNAPVGTASVELTIAGLRSAKGMVRACLTANPRFFPYCDKDPASLKASVAAGPQAVLHFARVASGDYAMTVLHDENSNLKADMFLGIPREGVGFSENPKLGMKAPSFDAARFRVGTGATAQHVTMKYFF